LKYWPKNQIKKSIVLANFYFIYVSIGVISKWNDDKPDQRILAIRQHSSSKMLIGNEPLGLREWLQNIGYKVVLSGQPLKKHAWLLHRYRVKIYSWKYNGKDNSKMFLPKLVWAHLRKPKTLQRRDF
jgi:hypothetical protein